MTRLPATPWFSSRTSGTVTGGEIVPITLSVPVSPSLLRQMKIGVVAFTTTLMLAGASHAADKIAFICSDGKVKDDYSLSIDLHRKLASFHMSELPDADGIPVIRVTENYIWFQNKASSGVYSQGELDRLTGSLHFFHRHLNNAKDYNLRCKPVKPFDGPAL
jgi:hypothetical protein